MSEFDDLADILDDEELFADMVRDDSLFDTKRYARTVSELARASLSQRQRVRTGFDSYRQRFEQVYAEIASGKRQIKAIEDIQDQSRITKDNPLKQGNFYVDNGVMLLIEKIYDPGTGESFETSTNRKHKVHAVYENGTENHIWLLSLISSLYDKKRGGRLVTENMDDVTILDQEKVTTGYIYVVTYAGTDQRFLAMPNLYKIGVAKDIQQRLRGTENQATYLYAPVRLVQSYELRNLDATVFERTLHHALADKRVQLSVTGPNDKTIEATEWFVVELEEIDHVIKELIVKIQ